MLTISRQALAISVGGEATVAFQFVVKRFMDRNPCWFTQFGGRWRARCGSRFLRADVLPPSREPASHFQKSPTAILAGVRGILQKNISEKVITNAFQTLESSPAPIRWVMVDDGYLHEKKGRLLNCIAQPNVNSLQTKYSALTRSSPDYNQRNKNKNKCSTYQSFASHLWMGQTVGHVSYSRSA